MKATTVEVSDRPIRPRGRTAASETGRDFKCSEHSYSKAISYSLYFADTVLQADLLVSMPKLKTHHWAGMTLSMKNLFGIVPGLKYGWPKNFLHWHGIYESIIDINSTIRSHFAIVDGIVGMEGNGPIQGTPKPVGVLVFGDDPVAVDATCARVARLNPERIEYLKNASEFLGNLQETQIQQIGSEVSKVKMHFQVIEGFRYLQS